MRPLHLHCLHKSVEIPGEETFAEIMRVLEISSCVNGFEDLEVIAELVDQSILHIKGGC